MVLSSVQSLFSQTMEQWMRLSYQDVEIALTLLFMMGEAMPVCTAVGDTVVSA